MVWQGGPRNTCTPLPLPTTTPNPAPAGRAAPPVPDRPRGGHAGPRRTPFPFSCGVPQGGRPARPAGPRPQAGQGRARGGSGGAATPTPFGSSSPTLLAAGLAAPRAQGRARCTVVALEALVALPATQRHWLHCWPRLARRAPVHTGAQHRAACMPAAPHRTALCAQCVSGVRDGIVSLASHAPPHPSRAGCPRCERPGGPSAPRPAVPRGRLRPSALGAVEYRRTGPVRVAWPRPSRGYSRKHGKRPWPPLPLVGLTLVRGGNKTLNKRIFEILRSLLRKWSLRITKQFLEAY